MFNRLFPILAILVALAIVFAAVRWSRRDHPTRDPVDPSGPRTVVLITIDTLRADALPIYGNPRVTTPAISSVIPGAVVFEEAISPAPWTRPAIASLLTGLPPSVHGNTSSEAMVEPDSPRGLRVLPEAMFNAGYRTAAFGYNPFLAHTGNLGRGFRDFEFQPTIDENGKESLPNDRGNRWVTEKALAWLDAHRDKPCFLWLHYYDPHIPYNPKRASLRDADYNYLWPVPKGETEFDRYTGLFNNSLRRFMDASRGSWLAEERGETIDSRLIAFRESAREALRTISPLIRAFYDAELREVDESIGRVFSRLQEQGRFDDALIALTSDHGEELFDHGDFEHGHTLHREVVRVPLIIRAPGVEARRVRDRVSTVSLLPTLLDLCGIPVAPEQRIAPALLGPRAGERWANTFPHIVSESMLYGPPRIAVYLDGTDFKYERRLDNGEEVLYRLSDDPGELKSIAAETPEVLESGRRAVAAYVEWANEVRTRLEIGEGRRVEQDERIRKLLRAHGYLK